MQIGIAITNICNAKCLTCPSHLIRPKTIMQIERFRDVLEKIAPHCSHLFLNLYGDFLWLPNANEYVDEITKFKHTYPDKKISITTNAGWPYEQREKIKPLYVDIIVVSFNAHPSDYNRVVGLDFETVKNNIEWILSTFGEVEIHTLLSAYNDLTTQEFRDLFPNARRRCSKKIENQCLGHERSIMGYCSYIEGLSINPDCSVRICAHDWLNSVEYGNLLFDSVESIIERRNQYLDLMRKGEFPAKICKYCNFPEKDVVFYV